MSPSGDVGGGGEISGGIWARERGNTAHIPPGEQKLEENKVGQKEFFLPETVLPNIPGW